MTGESSGDCAEGAKDRRETDEETAISRHPSVGRQGQGAPQVVALPPGHIKGAPAAQSTMSHAWVPARPAEQSITQCAPAAHVE
jgi:hypothetical protein